MNANSRLHERKGARRRSEIPPQVLAALERGEIETRNLVEWLAIDLEKLITNTLAPAGLERELLQIIADVRALAGEGVMRRMRGAGEAVHRATAARRDRAKIYKTLGAHPSDTIRSIAAYAICADGSLNLTKRLAAARLFAADSHMGVRECAWDSFREYLIKSPVEGLELLQKWVADPDARVRRCAVESTRPRGVWTRHFELLKKEPELALPLLEPVRSDSSDYVRKSVANWINDASKSNAIFAKELCRRWRRESPTAETTWITRRALRTLEKSPQK